MSEFERKHWVEALGGTWPAINTLQKLRADSVEDNLNSMAFTFLKDCLQELESRGLNDQGLYRVGGVVSKVKKLLNEGLISTSNEKLDLSDPKQWESKTIASAVKQYFRDLNKPLMTHTLYVNFVESVKQDNEASRMEHLLATMKKMPVANREMLKVLIRHLGRVAAKHETNLMTAANLGVVFGPTLLRPKEETVASIMDIKFCNEVVEILIENCDTFFPPLSSNHSDSSSPESGPGKNRKGRAPPVPNSNGETTVPVINDNTPSSRGGVGPREQRGSSTPKRTHSFSSFSQLSTNSLPDIKELHPTVLSIANHRHHYHGHGHGHMQDGSTTPSSGRILNNIHNHKPLSIRDMPDAGGMMMSGSSNNVPGRKLKKATSKDEDLMASLEMMESLAADLPINNSGVGPDKFTGSDRNGGLKRSYTVLHHGHGRSSSSRDGSAGSSGGSNHKPPLPKLSSPVISTTQNTTNVNLNSNHSNHASNFMNSDTSSTGSNHSSVISGNSIRMDNNWSARQVIGPSRISPTGSSSHGSSPHIYPTSSPRPNRPKELFVRQITLPMDSKLETPIVPSPSLVTPVRDPTPTLSSMGDKGSYNRNSNNQVPPPIPARRYARASAYHQQLHQHYLDNGERSGTSDSGILTSPSPPTDSGIAMSPPTPKNPSVMKKIPQTDDTLSLCSSSSSSSASSSCHSGSEASSGSRYDNVVRVPSLSSTVTIAQQRSSENLQVSKNSAMADNRRFSNDSCSPASKTSTLVAAAAEIAAQRLSVSPTREISTQTIEGQEHDQTCIESSRKNPSARLLHTESGTGTCSSPLHIANHGSQSEAECNCDGDDEDEETSDSSSDDILVLDSSSSADKHDIMGSNPHNFDEEEDLDDDEIDGDQATKNHDEIEISDHFTRRSNRRSGRAIFSTGHTSSTQIVKRSDQKHDRDSGPYDNFTLPGAVLQVPVVHHKTTSVAVNAPAPQGSAAGSKTKAHHSSSVSSSVISSSPASSPGNNRISSPEVMGSNPGPTKVQLVRHNSHHEEHLEPASIKRLLATGPTSNV